MVNTYQVHTSGSAGEAALLAVNKLTKAQIADALKIYAKRESVIIGTILGVSVDGVIFTPVEGWQPNMADAFTDICIVPWIQIHELLGNVPDGTMEGFFDGNNRN
ncbi:MAG: hypothetical protein HY370_04225 [Proteobacteria bacterium]|nr:hypothetical protein [Pseudomonadota bacterium]